MPDTVEDALSRFEAAWVSGTPPRIEDFLAGGLGPARRLELLRRLVNTDLRRRLQDPRQDAAVEAYLRRFPELAADAEAVVGLAAHEFFLRRSLGRPADLDDCLRRFPGHEAALRPHLQATADFFTAPPGGPGGAGTTTRPPAPTPPPGAAPPTVNSLAGWWG